MSNWHDVLVRPDDKILTAVRKIDTTMHRVALVVDNEKRLLGTLTDGDVRRALLNNVSLDSPVEAIMNPHPRVARPDEPWEAVRARMKADKLVQVPVVDERGRIIDLRNVDTDPTGQARHSNLVVLMAGGEGRRLRPLTESVPKPLIPIAGKPLLEIILQTFQEQGYRKFFVAVNYKREMVRDHFGSGERWDVDVRYLEEGRPLGTAGALSLLPERPAEPFIVMNGDLLTNLDFRHLVDYHIMTGADATICVRDYDTQVPFGVATLDDQNSVLGIVEKPVFTHFVNAGIYVLNPSTLDHLQYDCERDMPDLLEHIIKSGGHVVAFPIREYWLDVGNKDALAQAEIQYHDVFGSVPRSAF